MKLSCEGLWSMWDLLKVPWSNNPKSFYLVNTRLYRIEFSQRANACPSLVIY
jgi:hypothetical protein